MGGRTTSSRIPTSGTVLQPSQVQVRHSPLPSETSRSNRTRTCLLDAILESTELDYTEGFRPVWLSSDARTSTYIEFGLSNGVTTLIFFLFVFRLQTHIYCR